MFTQKTISSILFLMLCSCNSHIIDIKNIEHGMNKQIGKPFNQTKIHKLIYETELYREYETDLGNGCTWSVNVDKKSNLILSWKITSSREPCEEGVVSNG